MSKLEQLKAYYEKLGETIKVMESGVTYWEPDIGDEYWSIDTGFVNQHSWCNDTYDKQDLERGNFYRTEQEVLAADRRQVILTKLKRLTKGFVPNWGDTKQNKARILFSYSLGKFSIEVNWCCQTQGATYFATEQDAIDAIEAIGEDDMKFLMGVV